MSISARYLDLHLKAYSKNWNKFFLYGILLMIVGVAAVSATALTSLLTIIVIGFIMLFSGGVIMIDTFSFWHGRDHGFVIHFLTAVLYLAAGVILLTNPIEGAITLTFLLGVIYTMIGFARIFFSSSIRLPNWGWTLTNGVVTLILGIMILMSWPASSVFIIGLFVGIDIFFCGLAYTMAALAMRNKN